PVGIMLKDLRTRRVTPRWRNQALAWFLSRLQLAQAEGQGILTIRSTMKAAGCPPPIFKASEVSVTCVLRAHPRSQAATRPPLGTRTRTGRRAAPVKQPKARPVTETKQAKPSPRRKRPRR